MAYDILILTDHTGHTAQNSVYAFASALATHPEINSVDIASRGVAENILFFDGNMDSVLSVIPAIPRLSLRHARHLFETSTTETEITDYDFVILRLPQPIPGKLFGALPEVVPEDHIINEPSGIIRTSSKAFLLEVPDLCAPVKLVRKPADVTALLKQYPVVLKPLYGHGGKGLMKVSGEHAENGDGVQIPLKTFFKTWSPPYLAMEFLPRVTEGDKRTLVVNGQIIGSALRVPGEGSWMCNVARGGKSEHAVADKDEEYIAFRLTMELGKFGITMFGFDTLVSKTGQRVLSEVNTMSIGGIKQIRDAAGKPVMKRVVALLVDQMDRIWYGETGE